MTETTENPVRQQLADAMGWEPTDKLLDRVLEVFMANDAVAQLQAWLEKHPQVPFLIVKFKGKSGDFVTGAEFGEEAPDMAREARKDTIAEWARQHGENLVERVAHGNDEAVAALTDDLYERLQSIDANVMAGGAVHGAGDTVAEAIKTAIGGRS